MATLSSLVRRRRPRRPSSSPYNSPPLSATMQIAVAMFQVWFLHEDDDDDDDKIKESKKWWGSCCVVDFGRLKGDVCGGGKDGEKLVCLLVGKLTWWMLAKRFGCDK